MRILGEVWRRLLSISRSKYFASGRKLRNYRRARHNLYTPVSPSSRCSRCRVSTLSALTEVMQGVQGAQGARCGARGTSLLQASPPSTELRAQCAQRRWFPPDTDTRHQEQSPAPAFSPRHDNWYIDREFSMLRDIVLLILDISSYNYHVKILQ